MASADAKYIKEAFIRLYKTEWEAKGKTKTEFVKEVNKHCYGSFSFSYLSQLLKGRYAPTSYLHAFSEVLGVSINEFYPKAEEDKYRYSNDYQDEASKWLENVAKNSFSLNLSFLLGLKQLIDFDNEFPFFMPLEAQGTGPEEGYPFGLKYVRPEPVESAKAKEGGLFQIVHDGKTINLSEVDLKYLQFIQNLVVRKVREEFKHHKQELIDAMNEASDRCMTRDVNGSVTSYTIQWVPPEELQKIDKWGIYTQEEKNRCRIPDRPESLPLISAYEPPKQKSVRIRRSGKGKIITEVIEEAEDDQHGKH